MLRNFDAHLFFICYRVLQALSATYPCCDRRGGFLQHIPQPLLVLRALALAKFLFVPLPQRLRLLPHLLVHVLLPLVVLVLAARLQVQFVNTPVLQVVTEREDAHFVH